METMEPLPSIAHPSHGAHGAHPADRAAQEGGDRWPMGVALALLAAISLGLWALIAAAIVWVI
jgi:hypothetical protein